MNIRTKEANGFEPEFGWLLGADDYLEPGGHYDSEGKRIYPVFNDLDLPWTPGIDSLISRRKARQQAEKESYEEYHKLCEKAQLKIGKKILILSYEIEPPRELNTALGGTPDGIFYIRRVMARILSGGKSEQFENAYYYKISAVEDDFIPENELLKILDVVKPDYVVTIGDDLIYRLPTIEGDGPNLEISGGVYAETVELSYQRPSGTPVICLPMPYLGPWFDDESERLWHKLMVELFKL